MSLTEAPLDKPVWRKATASTGNGSCVEVATTSDGGIVVRDSKDPSGPILRYTAAEWDAFLHGAKGGEFDLDRRYP
jgi:hypothetical protein